jgi:hypothetical protein
MAAVGTWEDAPVDTPPTPEDSLTRWVVGVVSVALVALVAWLSRAMFAGVLQKLNEIATKVDTVATTVNRIDSASQIHGKDIDRHEQQLKRLDDRLEGLHKFWTEEFNRLRDRA